LGLETETIAGLLHPPRDLIARDLAWLEQSGTSMLIACPVSKRLFKLLMTAGQPLLIPLNVFGSFSMSSGRRPLN